MECSLGRVGVFFSLMIAATRYDYVYIFNSFLSTDCNDCVYGFSARSSLFFYTTNYLLKAHKEAKMNSFQVIKGAGSRNVNKLLSKQ